MSKDDKPRGLRARLRQRRARTSSEDEVKSRPSSLDLGRNPPPSLSSMGHSLTAVPTRAAGYSDGFHGGLALGEFSQEGEEVGAEDDDMPAVVPRGSGALARTQSQEFASAVARRRVSSQSVPGMGGALIERSEDEEAGAHTDTAHTSHTESMTHRDNTQESEGSGEGEASSGEEDGSDAADIDADNELNAVYLRRNADFHMLFRAIPINELLLDDYGCALQRDILVQGRLYLTENYVCFYSNIFGWVTNLIIAFDEIVTIEKKMTALIIPNAIQVSTLHARHFFGSFIYRDSAYNQLYDLWAKSRSEKNQGLPEIGRVEDAQDGAGDVSRNKDVLNAYQSLSESEDGSRSMRRHAGGDNGGDDESSGSVSDTESEDSPHSDSDKEPATQETAVPISAGTESVASASGASSVVPVTATDSVISLGAGDVASKMPAALTPLSVAADAKANADSAPRLLARIPATPDGTGNTDGGDAPVQQMALHAPTTCGCSSHYAQEALDATFPLSLPLLFRVVFSAPVDGPIARQYLPQDKAERDALADSCTRRIRDCGNSDVRTEGWVPDPTDEGHSTCLYTYEKPLGFAIGPKSTAVEDLFRIETCDFDRAVVIEQTVRTPNVPSGTAFYVKIRHCLTWAAGPSSQPPGGWTHYRMTFEVEWIKTSWIRNAIEKGSSDSNKQAGELLEKYIREWIAAHPAMEVRAQSLLPVKGSDPGQQSAARHKRPRKHGNRHNKRDDSPRGLRLEEVLGDSERASGRNAAVSGSAARRASMASGSAVPAQSAQSAGKGNAGDAGQNTKSAKDGARRGAGLKLAEVNVVMVSVVFAVLAAVLVVSNSWRFTSSTQSPSVSSSSSAMASNKELLAGMAALKEQMEAISSQLQRLIELQQQN
ncbi:hypothetical protein GGI07_000877 [Coemansia sp. Benny D115]|nr:hypothetical protein GGI07_000877 [Coemansia sp. Benny D115]